MEKITQINFNWRFSQENREEFDNLCVGVHCVIKIEEHAAMGDGDRWFYHVYFEDGKQVKVFNPNMVYLS
jgi:hypothetical protein